jgi:hypothetical protein
LQDPPPGFDSWVEALEARLVALGAVRLGRHEPSPPMGAGHIVMADPEGNEFYVA